MKIKNHRHSLSRVQLNNDKNQIKLLSYLLVVTCSLVAKISIKLFNLLFLEQYFKLKSAILAAEFMVLVVL
ncbi:hypothetical protein [Paraglaciecola sp.]|uniref:hypothetical protein n=1 Tax=Paraglaciecola sp. TaxID=1920173 RepID=UPI0030F424D0